MKPIRFILGALTLGLLGLLPLQAAASDIQVTPMSYDYGDVAVGQSRSTTFQLESMGPTALMIYAVSIDPPSDSFAITALSTFVPQAFPVGVRLDVTVTFEPASEGAQTANLYIVNNSSGEEQLKLPLTGTGIPATQDPAALMEELLAFFDEAVANEALSGAGPTPTAAAGRLGAFANMLEAAQALILAGDTAAACEQLTDAYLRVDGNTPPPDFVAGTAAAELMARILALRAALGC